MVPSKKMLFWTAFLVVPLAGVSGLLPATAALPLVIVALFAAIAVADALLSRGTMAGLRVRGPEVVRLWKGRAGSIELTIDLPAGAPALPLRVALPLDESLNSPHEEMPVTFPSGQPAAKFAWPCTPARRGKFQLTNCHVEAPSVFGLWRLRHVSPLATELRVYPDFLTERRRAASLFLNRGAFGVHARRQIGKGRDFEQLREYVHGDSYEDIHWKAAAKRNQPVTKVFQVERTQEVYVALDVSRLMARPSSDGGTMLERAVTAAVLLGRAAELQNDLFGLIAFSDRIEVFRRASAGRAARDLALDALYAQEPREVSPDFQELFTFLRLRLRRRALVIVLTCLDDPAIAEQFARSVDLVSRQHLLLVNVLTPSVVRPLFSDENVTTNDDLIRELGGHVLWQKLRALKNSLRRRGVSLHQLDHEKLCAELVAQYMDVKGRQAL